MIRPIPSNKIKVRKKQFILNNDSTEHNVDFIFTSVLHTICLSFNSPPLILPGRNIYVEIINFLHKGQPQFSSTKAAPNNLI